MRTRPTTDTAIKTLKEEYIRAKNTLKDIRARAIVGRRVVCPRVRGTVERLCGDIKEMRVTLRFYGVLVD